MLKLLLPEVGFIALMLATLISAMTCIVVLVGSRRLWSGIAQIAVFGTWCYSGLLAVAFSLLTLGFVVDDFSVVYIAQHSHSALPLLMKIAAVWGGHEGSLLLWLVCLAGWSTLFSSYYRRETDSVFPLTLAMLAGLLALLLLFVVLGSDPFVRIFPPAIEGRDLNPMLQHPGLIFHPPLLYMGYSGLIVGAALALAALLRTAFTGQTAWLCWRWVLPGWCFLTLGIALGSWWAYCELGWGGWWFWDPVENASLMPWLTSTGLLHCLLAHRTGKVFPHWSLLLAILTLILSLLGTLIVRTGILVSVHAFALDNVRAVPLFALFTFVSLTSLGLYAWRARAIAQSDVVHRGSREMYLLLAAMLFVAMMAIVLLGTLYPMVYGLMGWGRLSVGAPYFNRALLPFGGLAIVVLFLFTWRHWRSHHLPATVAHVGVALLVLGIAVSAFSKQETSLIVAQGQRVELAGYSFRFERLDQFARDNYTTERAVIGLYQHDKRVAELAPERRFYVARRQEMIEPGLYWNLIDDAYSVMGEKVGEGRYAMRFYVQSGVRWIWGGSVLMVIGGLLGWWRGRHRHA